MKRVLNMLLIATIILIVLFVISVTSNAVEVSSREYNIEEDIISYIMPNTSVERFDGKIQKIKSVQTTIKDGEENVTDGLVKTGMEAVFIGGGDSDTYSLSVVGDVSADGLTNQIDLSAIIRHIIGLSDYQIVAEEKLISADINGDSEINTIDLSRLIRFIITDDEKYLENPNKSNNPENFGDVTVYDYGQYVDLGTDILEKTIELEDGKTPKADWRIFKKDDNGVWLILADYMPNSAFDVTKVGLVASRTYEVKSPSNRATLLNGLDASGWKKIISENAGLYYNTDVIAKGAIDLETWLGSWEDNGFVHVNTAKRTGMSGSPDWGYYIYQDGEDETDYTTRLSTDTNGYGCTLYFPHKSDLDGCMAYWLNSPSSQGTGAVVDVTKYGCLDAQGANIEEQAVRPVIYLPSDVPLNTDGDVWEIGEIDDVKYETFEMGDEVKIGNESFFVIESSGENTSTVKLITQLNVETTNYTQRSNANTLPYNRTSPYSNEYVSSTIKTYVDEYKTRLETRTGINIKEARLMLFDEMNALAKGSGNLEIIYGVGRDLNYWLGNPSEYFIGTGENEESNKAWFACGSASDIYGQNVNYYCDVNYRDRAYQNYGTDGFGLRPVIVVSKENVEKVAYESYSIGEVVKFGSEYFYVIEASDSTTSTVKLITRENLETSNYTQTGNANIIAFDNTSPYSNVYAESTIKTLVNSFKSRLETRAGKDILVARLMLFDEMNALAKGSGNPDVIYGASRDLNYWLGNPREYFGGLDYDVNDHLNQAWFACGTATLREGSNVNYFCDVNYRDNMNQNLGVEGFGLRPVIIVKKEDVEKAQLYSLADKVNVGDYVAYNATNSYSYTSAKGTGSAHGNGNSSQSFSSNNEIKWRVHSKNASTGEVVLISEEPTANLRCQGAVAYIYAEEELNRICAIYGHGEGADTNKVFTCQVGSEIEGNTTVTLTGSGARSINVDDINNVCGVTPSTALNSDYGTTYKFRHYYPSKLTLNGISSSTVNGNETDRYYKYTASNYVSSSSDVYKMYFGNSNINYWLASRSAQVGMDQSGEFGWVYYEIRNVNNGIVGCDDKFQGVNGQGETWADTYGIRPIVYLKTSIKTPGKDTSGAWILK